MNLVYKLVFIVLFINYTLYAAEENLIESQPEIIFQFEKLKKSQENLSLQIDFNKAVLHLSKNEYEEAIKLFEKTSKILEVPTFIPSANTESDFLIPDRSIFLIESLDRFLASCFHLVTSRISLIGIKIFPIL